ncbi:MAG: hypothetical protein EOQ76_13920 [Mesorhizobium sp.]|nr:MAG: hypothetical protein EOQ76_13920 [Mesorhizobium sp.]
MLFLRGFDGIVAGRQALLELVEIDVDARAHLVHELFGRRVDAQRLRDIVRRAGVDLVQPLQSRCDIGKVAIEPMVGVDPHAGPGLQLREFARQRLAVLVEVVELLVDALQGRRSGVGRAAEALGRILPGRDALGRFTETRGEAAKRGVCIGELAHKLAERLAARDDGEKFEHATRDQVDGLGRLLRTLLDILAALAEGVDGLEPALGRLLLLIGEVLGIETERDDQAINDRWHSRPFSSAASGCGHRPSPPREGRGRPRSTATRLARGARFCPLREPDRWLG